MRDGGAGVAWTEQVPGAITEGATVAEARGRLIAAIHEMRDFRSTDHDGEAEGRVLVEVLET